jgi:cell division septation protein DedD
MADMQTVRVYAHHGPIPSGFLTVALPELPLPDTPQPVKEYWCELAAQSIVDSPPGYTGPGYGPTDALAPDQWRWDLGYAPTAVDFTVTGLCVLLVGAARDDYEFVLISPAGIRSQVPAGVAVESMTPMPDWGDPEAPYSGLQACWGLSDAVVSGRGTWRIQVFQKDGVAGIPGDAAWANGVSCVQLYDSPDEGFLAVQFTGVEVAPTTTTTTTPAPTTTTTTTPAPTTTTTTTTTPAPTTTTTTTTPVPIRDRLGCFGTVVLLVALAITAAAAVTFFVWACRGYLDVVLFATAVSLAVAATILLPAWMLLFRDGSVRSALSDWFARLSVGLPLLAAVFAIIGEFNCAGGVLIVSGLFGVLVSVLRLSRRIARLRRVGDRGGR